MTLTNGTKYHHIHIANNALPSNHRRYHNPNQTNQLYKAIHINATLLNQRFEQIWIYMTKDTCAWLNARLG